MGAIAERYRKVLLRIDDACDTVGRDPADVLVVAVSKTVGPDDVREALAAGIRDFGENRAREFADKQCMFPEARWHAIGTLQTNKVGLVVGRAELIHSIDSVRLLQSVDRHATELGIVQRVLLEVNVSGETSKHGFHPDDLEHVLSLAPGLPGVAIQGLMTMAPLTRPQDARPVFRDLARLLARLQGMHFNGVELTELSMGMTNDYHVAVEEGATIVRAGRAIFGR
jgi:pyridoxal phosphate enzyme (YggS family)